MGSTLAAVDVVILGAGHNALVLQAYLARCGLRTLALDRAAVPGGGLTTIANPRRPGFLHHPHSFFHRAITASRGFVTSNWHVMECGILNLN